MNGAAARQASDDGAEITLDLLVADVECGPSISNTAGPGMTDEPALQIECGNCGQERVISLMRLRMLAYLRCGCGHMLLDEDEVREYRQRLERGEAR